MINGPEMEVVYHIETKLGRTSKRGSTCLYKQEAGGSIYLIASLEFACPHNVDEDLIVFHDIIQVLSSVLPRDSTKRCARHAEFSDAY